MNPDLIPQGQDSQTNLAVPAIAALTRPLPMGRVEKEKHYMLLVPNASMHRTDGKKLAFLFGYLGTDFAEDIKFLDGEITAGNQYLREATAEEVRQAKMRLDPRGTMAAELKQEMEPAIRAAVEAELREKLEKQIRAELGAAGSASGSLEAAADGEKKLAGVDTMAQRAAKAAAETRVGNATVALTGGVPAIKPVSTADIAGASPASGK